MLRGPRLIEHAFPLKQTSLDSVHEKNVRHGHISTLHIWPARRPLAACRAALIATLLPDPGSPEKRKELCERIGGKLVKNVERKKMSDGSIVEREKEETEGGILHWGRETSNKADLAWQVRAWGRWVLKHARRELGKFYPTYADFEPLGSNNQQPYERREMQLVPVKVDGTPDICSRNKDFTPEYLDKPGNPRWIAKPTVAYLWARTVTCKNCRPKRS